MKTLTLKPGIPINPVFPGCPGIPCIPFKPGTPKIHIHQHILILKCLQYFLQRIIY